MFILPKSISRVNIIPIKIPMVLFTEIGKKMTKFTQNHKNRTAIWRKKNKVGVIIPPNVKL